MTTTRIGTALTLGALSIGVGASQPASADDVHSFSANIGAVSNYIFRGVTQTDDKAAIQGGVDYAHISGFYAGTWVSNVDFGDVDVEDESGNVIDVIKSPGYEADVYLGFSQSINDDLSFDLNAIYYAYPDGDDLDFAEIGGSATWKWVTLGLAYTAWGQAEDAPGVENGEALFKEGDWYYYGSFAIDLPMDFGLDVHGGYYDFDYNDGGNDYGHWGLSISREAGDFGTFSLNYDQVGRDTYDDDPKIWVGWLKEF
ncbi:MAG: TorF family putative porin [Thiocapsa sp.]|jgi:uncharacterized protein (TIGR02001 family)|nr:TorF family putative porin [Thiocapsa sp.]MCG6898335.1 TorF family putative porin [Thiocapsa sp.]MCG6984741.1 TorF family putative porin [Thiocapsa sp.]